MKATIGWKLLTNLVGRVALTNDIPDVSGYATPADVTAAIREQSLGGIWDETLQVWWTPRMRNGSLTYEATLYADAPEADYETAPQAYVISVFEANSETQIPIRMARSGGFALSLRER